jgi:hypothetical protein
MSEAGQKRRLVVYQRLPVYPDQRTMSDPFRTSRLCQDRTHQWSKIGSFDHRVGDSKNAGRNDEAERLGSLDIDDELEPGW